MPPPSPSPHCCLQTSWESPAIFSLLDPATAEKKPSLEENDFEHLVLSFVGKGKVKDKEVDLKIAMVVVGQSEG